MKFFVHPLAAIGLSLFTVVATTGTSTAQAPAAATTSNSTVSADEHRGYLVKVGDRNPAIHRKLVQRMP